eukprot:comp26248_c0_seq1/m.47085 comp26248_c0_seq1/g.47085  ORF comp26248_c0_seq1/g.47085 comp26248_c0_seq1/m.47085 type:complete len:133 (-) comp26248_c0_seq1:84-482(-)
MFATRPLFSVLSQHGPNVTRVMQEAALALTQATTPVKLAKGGWMKPKITPKQLATLRKNAALMGVEFPVPPKPYFEKAPVKPKGHKWEKEKAAREAKIKANLAKMEDMIAEHHKKLRDDRQAKKEKKRAMLY